MSHLKIPQFPVNFARYSNDDFLKYDTECEKGEYLVAHSGKTSVPVLFKGDVRDYYATIIIKPNY